MDALGFVLTPDVSPAASLAYDRRFLDEAAERRRSILRVYGGRGDLLSLGRYHRAPRTPSPRVGVFRRHSGGRAVPFGDGFLGVGLTLPHRAALVADDPLALAPEQVMNRCVRGILDGLALAGLSAVYPGRDTITVERRVIGTVSFEIDGRGATLFEAVVAVGRDLALLPHLLDCADPGGIVTADMLGSNEVTSVARGLGRTPALEEMARFVRRGYETRFDVRCTDDPVPPPEPFDEVAWLAQRVPRPELDHHGVTRTMLGSFEAHFALATDGSLADIVFSGDFIADSPGIERLERELRGCRAERDAILAIAAAVFGRPEHFILGVGPLGTIADVVVRGLP